MWAPGVLAPGATWWPAAGVSRSRSPCHAIWALLIGGCLIHPLAASLFKLLGARGAHRRGNPLSGLAAASTVGLILSLPLAYGLSQQRVEWFFLAILCVIGGR